MFGRLWSTTTVFLGIPKLQPSHLSFCQGYSWQKKRCPNFGIQYAKGIVFIIVICLSPCRPSRPGPVIFSVSFTWFDQMGARPSERPSLIIVVRNKPTTGRAASFLVTKLCGRLISVYSGVAIGGRGGGRAVAPWSDFVTISRKFINL